MKGPGPTAALLSLAVALGCASVPGCGSGPSRPATLKADTEDLRATVVLAHREEAIPEGKNALWCATAQLAWDAFPRNPSTGPLRLGPPADPALVALLNRRDFPAGALDPNCFVALGGFDDRGIVGEIRDELRRKFGSGDRTPEIPPSGAPWTAVAYAYLLKSLPFEHPFEAATTDFRFASGTKNLATFIIPDGGERERRVRGQVTVLYGDGRPEGAVEIAPKGGKDRLLLALVPRGRTLGETWRAVAKRAAAARPAPLPGNALFEVPVADFDLTHRFRSLEGGTVDAGRDAPAKLSLFRQDIRFELNEAGARLESEAVMVAPGADVRAGPPPRFLFDRPFLLALRESASKEPYFLAWIGNDELLGEKPAE